MITKQKLLEEISKFDDDCLFYAYEGEDCGIVVIKFINNSKEEVGFIRAYESNKF